MPRHRSFRTLALIMLLGLAMQASACSALEAFASRETAPSAPPSAADGEPIPDPLHPLSHPPGDMFTVEDVTFTYLGVFRAEGGLEARLRLEDGDLPDDARLVSPDGGRLRLRAEGDLIVSDPFGDPGAPPPSSTTLTLVMGDQLIALEVGAVR